MCIFQIRDVLQKQILGRHRVYQLHRVGIGVRIRHRDPKGIAVFRDFGGRRTYSVDVVQYILQLRQSIGQLTVQRGKNADAPDIEAVRCLRNKVEDVLPPGETAVSGSQNEEVVLKGSGTVPQSREFRLLRCHCRFECRKVTENEGKIVYQLSFHP